MDEVYQKKIRDYYDYTLRLYRLFWHGDTRALHYGIWDKRTKNLREALINTNRILADKADIHRGDNVLDAGCGVGGSAFWIAQNIGAHVVGITVSKKQLAKAKELAKRRGLEEKLNFFLRTIRIRGLQILLLMSCGLLKVFAMQKIRPHF